MISNETFDLDATDMALLDALQTDAGISNLALAERLGVSPATCLRRTKRLEDAGGAVLRHVVPCKDLAVHGHVDTGRQGLRHAAGKAEVEQGVRVGDLVGDHGAGQHDRLAERCGAEDGGRLRHGVGAVDDDDRLLAGSLAGLEHALAVGVLHVERRRFVWKRRLYEQIRLTNHGVDEVLAPVTIEFGADFRDMFEVRGDVRPRRGTAADGVLNGRSAAFASPLLVSG